MKSWQNVEADYDMILPHHFTPGRAGHKIQFLVLHHNAGILSRHGTYNTFVTYTQSAHYQVDIHGQVTQHVWDRDTAWALGTNDMTPQYESISIEHANNVFGGNWTVSEATLDNGAHLVAALCVFYGLGEPQYGKNVFVHGDFIKTECPGALGPKDGVQHKAYMDRARLWYHKMTVSTNQPKPTHIVHRIVAGETLSGIAAKYGTTVAKLAADNNIPNPNLIIAGAQLLVKK